MPTAVPNTNTGTPSADYYYGCRWHTQNVQVTNNIFNMTQATASLCLTATLCGYNGIFSNYGSTTPYTSSSIPTAITFNQNNVFADNTYRGPWRFEIWSQGNLANPITWADWRAPVTDKCGTASEISSGTCNSGFGQDVGSTYTNPF